MLKEQIVIPQWMQASQEVRLKMREIFGIVQSSHTEVAGGVLITDGVTHKDLESLSVEKMQDFTGLEGKTIYDLFRETVSKIEQQIEDGKPKVVETEKKTIIEVKNNADGSITMASKVVSEPVTQPKVELKDGEVQCETCGKIIKSQKGLNLHKGKYHKK
jgi:hypothetical protein